MDEGQARQIEAVSDARRRRSDSVTPEEVEQAMDSITARNEAVTLKRLREEIGHGSMSTLSSLLCAVRARQKQTDELLFENNPVYKEEAQKVAMRLVEIAYKGNQELAQSRVTLVEKALESVTLGYQQELSELGQQVDELTVKLDSLGSENRSLKAKIAALNREVNTVSSEKSKIEGLLSAETALRTRLEQELSDVRSKHNTVDPEVLEMLKQITKKLK